MASIVVPLAVAIAGATLLFVVLWAAVRDRIRAGLAATWLVVLFFSYGHVRSALEGQLPREASLLGVWIVLAAAGLIGALSLRRAAAPLTTVLNGVGLLLLVMNAIPIAAYQLRSATPAAPSEAVSPAGVSADRRPDVYNIILDRYAGEQTLRELYDFDNRPFLDALASRGFYVAGASSANYPKTTLAVTSALNMDYLDLGAYRREADTPADEGPLHRALVSGYAAERFLQDQGYTYVHIATWWDTASRNSEADLNLRYGSLSEFSSVLLESTLLSEFDEELGWQETTDQRELIRRHALYQFDRLAEMPDLAGPTFVFAHISLPHDPYVFDSEGNPVMAGATGGSETTAYLEQLQYTNARILELIDLLLAGPPEEDPVILLYSDEGPYPIRYQRDETHFQWLEATPDELEQKFRILNAYHLPGVADPGLYPSVSPVNSFRLVFNAYFGTDLPLLPDRSYVFRDRTDIYQLVDISDRVASEDEESAAGVGPPARYRSDPPETWEAATRVSYAVSVTNTGTRTWEATGPQRAELGVLLVREDATPGDEPVERVALPRDVAPGESVTIRASLTAPDLAGDYTVRHRLVEGLAWSPDADDVPVRVTSSAASWAGVLDAGYEAAPPSRWTAGETRSYSVTLTNTGSYAWNARRERPIRLGVHFGTESDTPGAGWATDQRFTLPENVPPGESVIVRVRVTAPNEDGSYVLRHRLVKEGTAWFDEIDETPATVTSSAESWARLLSARYEVSPPVTWASGETRSYDVTVTNAGPSTWNTEGGSFVRLGVSFGGESDAPAEEWATDERFTLPGDVPPGRSVTFRITVTAPTHLGSYVLRHRLVKEDVAWFDELSRTPVRVTTLIHARARPLAALALSLVTAGAVAVFSDPARGPTRRHRLQRAARWVLRR